IASILRAQGYKVGLYTSPHLIDFTERIRVNGEEIGRDDVLRLMTKIRPAMESMASESKTKQPTFFEVATAMAFMYFAEKKVDFAVLEVGLGGRLDATNVVDPLVTVITRITHEHTEHLGKELDRIAWEKAGIIKENVPVVTTEKKFQKVIRDVAKEKGAKVLLVGSDIKYASKKTTLKEQSFIYRGKSKYELKTKLIGRFQLENAAAAVGAVETLKDAGINISPSAIRKGVYEAEWPGRFQVVMIRPLVILDCAHNPDGARALTESLRMIKRRNLTLVAGMLKDKDIEGIAKALGPLTRQLIVASPKTSRACAPAEMKKAFHPYVDNVEIEKDVGSAVDSALSRSGPDDTVCITGSIYTIGEAMEHLKNAKLKKVDRVMKGLRSIYLRGAFPGKDVNATTLKKEEREPFRVLMATILSHRTRDENTHLAVERLFKRYDTPRKIAKANVKRIESLIRPAGFYTIKAKRLKEVSRILLDEFDGKVPDDFDSLMSLPSVGRKTANCVLVYGFGIEAIPVDTHLHRIPNRLGLVETTQPEETEKALTSFVPRKYWLDLNELFVK
ncbi:MAG: hypothetical protein KAI64_01020, partial [Thermoplasmata archaeon]|nr:hypothetical protein [Thermoplasmata archaeon]